MIHSLEARSPESRSVHHCSTIHSGQDIEATYTSIDRGAGKEEVVCIRRGILCSHENDRKMSSAATQIDLQMIILSEVIQTENNKYYRISLTGGI